MLSTINGSTQPDHDGGGGAGQPITSPPPEPAAPFPGEPGDMPAGRPMGEPAAEPVPQEPERSVPRHQPEPVENAAQRPDRFRDEVALLGDIARRGIRYQAAFLSLLDAYGAIFQATARALGHLHPADMDEARLLKDRLQESVVSVERALTAQQPLN